jgi:hypothetical protein
VVHVNLVILGDDSLSSAWASRATFTNVRSKIFWNYFIWTAFKNVRGI